MSATAKPRYLWFKGTIALGVTLGLLLLGQTVSTYRYVSATLIQQEAQREADRKVQALVRFARDANTRDTASLGGDAAELIKEAPERIAWMRILTADGKVEAAAGKLEEVPSWTRETIQKAMAGPGRGPGRQQTKDGEVYVSLGFLNFGRGRGFGGGPPGQLPQGRSPQPSQANPGAPDQSGPARGEVGPGGLAAFNPFDASAGQPQPAATPPDLAPANPSPANPSQPGRDGRGGFAQGGSGSTSGAGGRNGGPRNPGPIVETAIYLDGVSVNFSPLLQNLIVGVSAAVALLLAVFVIGLRFRHYLNARHMEEELALARRVQTDLFPTNDLLYSTIEYAARCVPAAEVGGDLYDVFETDDGGGAMVLGDVSGKGLPAALLMGVVQGAVRASSGSESAADHERAVERLNNLLCMKTARERFVSLFWCFFDSRKGRLGYINCGHLPPLLVRQNRDSVDVIRLEEGGGPVLGVLPGARYTQAAMPIHPGDILVVYSDGILEATNAAGEEFEEERIVAAIKSASDVKPGEICESILSSVRSFLGKELPHDDQTLMVVRLERVATIPGLSDATGVLARAAG